MGVEKEPCAQLVHGVAGLAAEKVKSGGNPSAARGANVCRSSLQRRRASRVRSGTMTAEAPPVICCTGAFASISCADSPIAAAIRSGATFAPKGDRGRKEPRRVPRIGSRLERHDELSRLNIQPQGVRNPRREMMAHDPCRAQHRMSGKRNFPRRSEDAHPVSAVGLGRGRHEGRLRIVHLGREALHRVVGQVTSGDENRQLVAGIGPLCKNVHDVQVRGRGVHFFRRPAKAHLMASRNPEHNPHTEESDACEPLARRLRLAGISGCHSMRAMT
jgi:hypothetical protein